MTRLTAATDRGDDENLVGRTLAGRYRVVRSLGAGGMGAVYVAIQDRIGREVALKVLRGGRKKDDGARVRFEREARALGQISHPAIVDIYDFDEDADGRLFIAMELVAGDTLRRRLRARGSMAFRETLPIVRSVASALEAAHKLGIIHRDLKPENIVLADEAGSPAKVLDFGIAKFHEERSDAALTGAGMIVGTPGYIAPEIILAGNTDDVRSDLYSLGVLWFELLAGQGPFAADTAMALLMMHATKPAPEILSVAPDCGITVEGASLLAALLTKRPEERPQSASAVIGMLDALLSPPSASMATAAISTERLSRPPAEPRPQVPSNLPARLTKLVGRESEVADVKARLSESRLVTIVGAGGAGKSRLALQVASDELHRFRDGACFVELAPIVSPIDVVTAVAGSVGVVPSPAETPRQSLISHVRGKQMLIVLDNCEHLVEACAYLVEEMLRACPELRVLATSREALAIDGEAPWAIPPLPAPSTSQLALEPEALLAAVAGTDAVRLFVERAGVTPTVANIAAIAAICSRLDGLPLAIELAAARARALGVAAVHARLDDRFQLLRGGSRTAEPRQQTLRALIDWSHDLLTDAERALLRRLSVFAGGFTLAAAIDVCSDSAADSSVLENLTQLVNKSLVEQSVDGADVRFRFLESLRHYAAEKLTASGETSTFSDRHVAFFLRFIEDADRDFFTPRQAQALTAVAVEQDNLRQATQWALKDPDIADRIAGAQSWFFQNLGHADEGRRVLSQVLAQNASARTAGRARALFGCASICFWANDRATAIAQFELSLSIRRELGLLDAVAATLVQLGTVVLEDGDPTRAQLLCAEALGIYRQLGNGFGISRTVMSLIEIARIVYDIDRAAELGDDALKMVRSGRANPEGIAWTAQRRGSVALMQGDLPLAFALLGEAVTHFASYKSQIGLAVSGLLGAGVAVGQGRDELAGRLLGAADAQMQREKLTFMTADARDARRYADKIRAQIGHSAYARAYEAGRGLQAEGLSALVRELIEP